MADAIQGEVIGIEALKGRDQEQTQIDRAQGLPIGDHHIDAAAGLATERAGLGREPYRDELHLGQAGLVQLRRQPDIISIGSTHHFERCVGAATDRQGAFDQAHPGVKGCLSEIAHVG